MVFDRQIVTQSPQETARIGQELADFLIKPPGGEDLPYAICLYGNLGSGKTTFLQGLAKGLGIRQRLLSPTFIIVRRYQLEKPGNFFYHVDLYRVKDELGIRGLGLTEILWDQSSFVAIEWAERLGSLMPKKRIDIKFEVTDENHHLIWITKS